MGCQLGAGSSPISDFRLVHSECHEDLESLGSQPVVCVLLEDSLEGAHASGLVAFMQEEPQKAIGAKNGTIMPLGQQEPGLVE